MKWEKIMKKFVRYYRPYRKVFLLDMLCALGISVIDLAFPQILNYLTDGSVYAGCRRQIHPQPCWHCCRGPACNVS